MTLIRVPNSPGGTLAVTMCIVHVGRVDDDMKFITRLFFEFIYLPGCDKGLGRNNSIHGYFCRISKALGFPKQGGDK